MFCGKCGKQLENGTKFCPYCGQAVDVEKNEKNILTVERKLNDLSMGIKMKVVVDKKITYKIKCGEKIEIPIEEGEHKVEISLNFDKKEIRTTNDNPYLVTAYENGVVIEYVNAPKQDILEQPQKVPCVDNNVGASVNNEKVNDNMNNTAIETEKPVYEFETNELSTFGKIGFYKEYFLFQSPKKEDVKVEYKNLKSVKKSFSTVSMESYTGKIYGYVIPKEMLDEIITYVNAKIPKQEEITGNIQNNYGGSGTDNNEDTISIESSQQSKTETKSKGKGKIVVGFIAIVVIAAIFMFSRGDEYDKALRNIKKAEVMGDSYTEVIGNKNIEETKSYVDTGSNPKIFCWWGTIKQTNERVYIEIALTDDYKVDHLREVKVENNDYWDVDAEQAFFALVGALQE